jgi:hypothetical protein
MVRVVIEHKIKGPEYLDKAIDVIREIRNEAMKERGFITGETLIKVDDRTNNADYFHRLTHKSGKSAGPREVTRLPPMTTVLFT